MQRPGGDENLAKCRAWFAGSLRREGKWREDLLAAVRVVFEAAVPRRMHERGKLEASPREMLADTSRVAKGRESRRTRLKKWQPSWKIRNGYGSPLAA